ncbi:MAG: apolipoprotein N-acyltransferase [Desulfobacteraceae bacterium Eth-SRB2]|nr:MAG: apolipoprotein N-acyltransferase [Desulfobacteraceae bacterium Eth-SRB2]
MRGKFFSLLFPIFAPVLSGVLLVLAFPSHNLGWLAWVALVPLLVAISGKRPGHGFLMSYLCGFVFFPGIFYWILQISGYRYLHHGILALYLGAYFGIWGLVFAFISKHWGVVPALFTAPFAWVSLEFIRSNFSFLALPWALLAHTQYQYPLIIQIASLSGIYGISFLIVLVNSAIAAITLFLIHRFKDNPLPSYPIISGKGAILIVVTAALSVTLALSYGFKAIARPIMDDSIKVSVVQGNIDQVKKWDRKYGEFIMQTYDELTRMASKDRPALIVWPETATPLAISRDHRLYDQVKRISQSAGAYLLLGSAQHQKFTQGDSKRIDYMNSAFLITPDSNAKNQRYDKIHLLPFGEYLPMEGTVPWSYLGIPHIRGYTPGKESTLFDSPSYHFGVTICWENIFPNLVRKVVKRGAQFIVNITNEAWFGKTSVPYQFVAMSVFRAVENRVSVVRCANTGVSCFINPDGRIIGKVQQDNKDTFVKGYLTKEIPLSKEKTFYTIYGDVFVYMSMIITILIIFLTVLKLKKIKKTDCKR